MHTSHSQVRNIIKGISAVTITLALSACANITNVSVQHTPDTKGKETASPAEPSPTGVLAQRLQGKLLDVDGITPVAGATVYIVNPKAPPAKHMLNGLSLKSTAQLSSTSVKQQNCAAPTEPYFAYACTRRDGSFELVVNQVQQLPLPITFIKGENKVSINLGLNDLDSDIGDVAFAIPEEAQQKIAIVLDFFNPYEDIKHQLKTGHYDMRDAFREISNQMVQMFDLDKTKSKVMFPKFASLFEDLDGDQQIDLYKYDIVYINSRNSKDISSLSKEKRKELLKYISRGGQLYITEWKIELPEVPLDQYI
jgi:hypothetical protein